MRVVRVVALALLVSACASTTSSESSTTTVAETTTSTPTTAAAVTTTSVAAATTTSEVTTTTSTVTVTTQPAPTTVYEAQDLLGGTTSPGLYTTVQDMSPWDGGAGWSGHDQVFVGGEKVGDWIEIPFGLPQDGGYVIQVVLTTAPDFATILISLDGADVQSIDLYQPGVMPTSPITLGPFTLSSAILHPIRFTVQSKNPQSTGYRFGIDQIIVVGPSGDY
jgi:hypothetical protein